jgi:hypothetical protein
MHDRRTLMVLEADLSALASHVTDPKVALV